MPRGLGGPTYLTPGTVLKERYEIVGEIGRGGFSVVYAARDNELESDVAIKLLVPPPADAHIARERMRREVQAVRGLSHPNIVAVHDFLESGDRSFLVMEFVRGSDISIRVREEGALDAEAVVTIGRGVAAALSAAHRRGILHRDVKPQNVLVEPDGEPRLTDFGSAKLDSQSTITRTGGLVGTLNYSAPELVAGQRGDGRSDVYALGMTLYFALTGRLPDSSSPHLPPPPAPGGYRPRSVRPEVPRWLDDAIARATAADPGDRFPTASSFAEALENREGVDAGSVQPRTLHTCVICGAPEPLGLAVCPRCGGVPKGVADTLIFAKRPMFAGDRETVADHLMGLLGSRAPRAELLDVASGQRALVRVPAASAEGVVEQLGRKAIPARAARIGRAWAPLPLRFYGMLAAIVTLGGAAGLSALPPLFVLSPLMATLLLLVAQKRSQTPVVELPKQTVQLPESVEKKVIEAFAQLSPGTPRSLLADLIRLGQNLHSNMARSSSHEEELKQLEELLSYSCDAAIDLSDLDESLETLTSLRDGRADSPSDEWLNGMSRSERTRDRLVQRFLEVISLLSRARSHSSAFLGEDGERLGELAREIESHCEAHAEAAQEIEQLLDATY